MTYTISDIPNGKEVFYGQGNSVFVFLGVDAQEKAESFVAECQQRDANVQAVHHD